MRGSDVLLSVCGSDVMLSLCGWQLSSIIRLEQRVEELMAELQEEKDEGRRRERENAALQKIARVRGQDAMHGSLCVGVG